MQLSPFSPKAIDFIDTDPAQDKFFTLLEGSIRSGKTWAMNAKILNKLIRYKVNGIRVLIGNSKASVYNNILRDLFNLVGKKNYRYNQQSGQLWLYGHEWLVIGVSNEGSERAIRGMTAGIIVWDEVTQAPKNVFDMAMSRLSPDGARFYGTTNPDTPLHYLLTDYLENENFNYRVRRIRFSLEDNYSLAEETRSGLRNMYTGLFYRRFILAEWVTGEGAIYRDVLADDVWFTDADRPVGLLGAGGSVARYIGVDYGTSNACVFLDVYDDGKTLWQLREYYWDSRKQFRQKTDQEYADDFEEFLGPNSSNVIVVIDPSAASFKLELQRRGYVVKEAKNDVMEGIRILSSLLALKRYRIHVSCIHTRDEMMAYSWDKKATNRGEEAPVKVADHTCDAARYVPITMLPKWRIAA